ncbi:unnamed protein product [Phaedon cochleariae]|uniref:Uncharacterized protein n=1 Tax=Phaedon cochleariae TaxID=80249 RepID=A0A9N9SE21_PHACE|nr:unnamed protein product [Phaedon cochleariae]
MLLHSIQKRAIRLMVERQKLWKFLTKEIFPRTKVEIEFNSYRDSLFSLGTLLLHNRNLFLSSPLAVENRFWSIGFSDDSTLHTVFLSRAPIPARQIRNERGRNVDNINMDLATILEWGSNNLVDSNAKKTQACLFSRKANLTLLMIYEAQIRSVLEYCSHIWSEAPKHTLKLLDSIQWARPRSQTNSLLWNTVEKLAIWLNEHASEEEETATTDRTIAATTAPADATSGAPIADASVWGSSRSGGKHR